MSLLAALIRPFWLPGLNAISGRAISGLSEWFLRRTYQVYTPLQSTSPSSRVDQFTLTMADSSLLLPAFASDCNRLATASFETVQSINRVRSLPRSTAWLLVKYYYAAYFGAHAILRMLGVSCSNIDAIQATAINEVIDLYGMANGLKVPSGTYQCSYTSMNKELRCVRQVSDKGGSHQYLWSIYYYEMRSLSARILSTSGIRSDQQEVASKIDELCDVLCNKGCTGGGWLSNVRNKVNYQHEFGAWYPYAGMSKSAADQLYECRNLWTRDALKIPLASSPAGDQSRFLSACAFIISLARLMVVDMAERHPENKSFHRQGSVAFLNLQER